MSGGEPSIWCGREWSLSIFEEFLATIKIWHMVIAEMRSHQGSHGIESCEAARTNGFRDWISDSFPAPSVPALFQHIFPQYGIHRPMPG